MLIDPRALFRVVDFFVPVDVLMAVLMVFTMENILEYLFTLYVPPRLTGLAWAAIYLVGVAVISMLNLVTADDEDLEVLGDDLDDL